MVIIGIIGSKASGKDTIAKYISDKHKGAHHSHSEILDDVLTLLHLPNSRENAIKLVALRTTFGENVLVNALNKKIKSKDVSVAVITGIRFLNEFENIRSYPSSKIISVSADVTKRFERQHQRHEKADDQTIDLEKFLALEQASTEKNIEELSKKADFHIENNGTEAELFVKVDAILQGII
ncbi:MAG: hypothetical protein NVSMB66_2110 [Candidatus Doudnabacteria bacterium]